MDTNLTAEFFNDTGKSYEDVYSKEPGLLRLIDKSLTMLPTQAKILDAGCGTGVPVSSTLSAKGHQVTGIDRAQTMVDLSRQQVPGAQFEKADILEYSPTTKFDAIFAIYCSFAFSREQMNTMLSNFSTWLRPGGLLLIGTIAADQYPTEDHHYDADRLYASGMDNEFMGQVVTISLLTKEGWNVFLQNNGLEVLETSSSHFEGENHYFITAKKGVVA